MAKTIKNLSGNFGSVPFPVLLWDLYCSEVTGILELSRSELKKKIFFREGQPVHAETNLLHETLGRFLVAQKARKVLEKLAQSKEHGSSFLKGAPLAIVVCADPEKCDVWIEDVSIASILIHLCAHNLRLGSCWIQIRDRMHNANLTAEQYVRQTLDIPENLKVESIIAIGYPDEQKPPHNRDSLQFEKVHLNAHGQPYPQ